MKALSPGLARRRLRVLCLEPLEDRRLLDAGLAPAAAQGVTPASVVSPWKNPTLALDVNHDTRVTALDALVVINRILTSGIGPLPAPDTDPPPFYYDTNGDGNLAPLDALRVINRLISQPQVTLNTLAPFSIDVTPRLEITATSSSALPDGTPVKIDVDLSGHGDFGDPGAVNYDTTTLFNGAANLALNPALPPSPPSGPYQIKLRARVTDTYGVEGFSSVQTMTIDTGMSDVLKNYVQTADPAYDFSVASTVVDPGGLFTYYVLNMTSQSWRTSDDVNQTLWQHWVQIVVPSGPISNTALLLIDGGSTNPNPPASPDQVLVIAALQTHSVVIDLKDIPNEPLTFTGDIPTRTRSEDAIIAYSFDQFMKHIGDPGNDSWPVLEAMVKSAARAMDSVQTFIPTVDVGAHIDDFVVTGYSKRGWTTWLTAAVDDRVIGIMPGVFDNLNQGPQMVHHFGVYGDRDPSDPSVVGGFSAAVQDYTNMNIFERILSPAGEQLSQIVDPYRYLNNGRFTIPKLLLDSAGDQFFVSDSAQFYFDDLPGTDNYIRYFPNTDHGLADAANDVLSSSLTFFSAILTDSPLPKFSWTVAADGSIHVQTVDVPTQVKLWQITNPTERDFRKDYIASNLVWTSSPLSDQGGGVYVGSTPMPASGATAFFVELTFNSPVPGNPYVFTTEIHVNTNIPLAAWTFFPVVQNAASPAAASINTADATAADLNPTAFALAAQAAAASWVDEATHFAGPPVVIPPPIAAADRAATASSAISTVDSSSVLAFDTGPDKESVNEAVDVVFGRALDEAIV